MKFVHIVAEDLIFAKQQVEDYDQALRFLCSTLADTGEIGCGSDNLYATLMEREALGGTLLPNGLAIPHVRLDCMDEFWVSLLTPRQPIHHNGIDLKIIALFLIPKSGSDMYLQTLSGLTKFSVKDGVMDQIAEAPTVSRIIEIFSPLEIKKEFLVGDIMTREPISVSPDTNIKEVADLFYSRNLSYLPVLSKDGKFIGEVTLLDLIREGVPDYALRIGDLSFLKSFEPFEELIRKEELLNVKDIMSKPDVTLSPSDAIASAGLNFIRSSRRQLPVVEGKTLVGVLSIIDLLKKVIRV